MDPRVRRTRRLLREALERLLESTAFEKLSVGEIAGEATLNRATFYDHFPDKYLLLEDLVRERFQEMLRRRKIVFDGRCPGVLRGIALAMCDYMTSVPGIDCPNRRQMERQFEAALIAVVRGIVLRGFEMHPPASEAPREMLAAMISGAMYSGVNEWLRTPNRPVAEVGVEPIVKLLKPLLEG